MPAARAVPRPRQVLRIRLAPYRLPAAVSGEVASPDGRHLLIAGGLLADQSSSRAVVRIDLRTGTASAAGQLALPVHDAASAILGGTLLVFGGGTDYSYATVQRPSPAGDGYGASGVLPAPRSDMTAVTEGHTVYLAGGHGNSGYARTVLATTDGRRFRAVATLPVPVRYPAVAIAGGDLWVFGGLTPHGPVADVQRVNLRTGQAQRAGRLPRPLEAGSAFTLAGTIYVAGGTTTADRPRIRGGAPSLVTSSIVRRFAPRRRSFLIAGRLPAPVSHAAVAVTGEVAYLVGGLDGSRTMRTISTLHLGPGATLAGQPRPVRRRAVHPTRAGRRGDLGTKKSLKAYEPSNPSFWLGGH